MKTKFPSRWSGNFKMPMRMMRWLEIQLAGEQFKLEAIAIAVYVARVWASPQNLGKEFCLSRPEICQALGYSDWAVRQGLILLDKIQYLHRLTDYAGEKRQKARMVENKGMRHPPHIYILGARIKAYFLTLLLRRNTPPEYKAPPEKIGSSSKNPNPEPSGGYILVKGSGHPEGGPVNPSVLPTLNDPKPSHGRR